MHNGWANNTRSSRKEDAVIWNIQIEFSWETMSVGGERGHVKMKYTLSSLLLLHLGNRALNVSDHVCNCVFYCLCSFFASYANWNEGS
jgi:hypothetical protein